MKESMEQVILQINGGDKAPTKGLEERELFVDLSTGYLYYGKSKSTVPVKIKSGESDAVGNVNSNFYVNASEATAHIGAISFSSQGEVSARSGGVVPKFVGMNYENPLITNPTITRGTWEDCQHLSSAAVSTSKLSATKLVVGPDSFGTEFPTTNLTVGQVFFKIT